MRPGDRRARGVRPVVESVDHCYMPHAVGTKSGRVSMNAIHSTTRAQLLIQRILGAPHQFALLGLR